MVVQGHHVPPGPFLLRDPHYEALKNTIVKCLFGADKRLADQAQQWGLKFMAVSDLNGNKVMSRQLHQSDVRDRVEDYFGVKRHRCRSSSPFSKEQLPPVHTPPRLFTLNQDYSEYIVDATLQKTDARAYLYGQAHQGFFESLFPTFSRLGLRFSPHGVSSPALHISSRLRSGLDHVRCDSYQSCRDQTKDSS
jgi:hypothetical protein